MKKYLTWNTTNILKNDKKILNGVGYYYDAGFVFTRVAKGEMHQTRSLRIKLKDFKLNSENKRILNKWPDLKIELENLPLLNYSWELSKLAKDFYQTKFKEEIFTVNKLKEILSTDKNNFNYLLKYNNLGYCIAYKDNKIMHYSYPFYDLKNSDTNNLGMAMMLLAITWAKENKLEYIYLGSLQRNKDIYKLQFSGLEYFTGNSWSQDIEGVKELLKKLI